MRLKLVAAIVGLAAAFAAHAQPTPTEWGLERAIAFGNPGSTRFEVLRHNERGGEIRLTRRDITCPDGATYLFGWSYPGNMLRVARGQRILVDLTAKQVAGRRCEVSEPYMTVGGEGWSYSPGFDTRAFPNATYEGIDRERGYQEFYLHPEEHRGRHRPSPWTVVVNPQAFRPWQFLVVSINTSGAPGGQAFHAALVYHGSATGSPVGGDPPVLPGSGPGPQAGMEVQTDRPGSDYRSFDLATPDPNLCRAQCEREAQCAAWTYSMPGTQGPQARCWLKSRVPNPVRSSCCISGVKPFTPPGVRPHPPVELLNLTGRWSGNDGGTYYLRHVGDQLWWYGHSGDGGASWTNVYHGRIQAGRISGNWADVPQGRTQDAGELEINIVSADRLSATRRTGGFGGSEWTRTGSAPQPPAQPVQPPAQPPAQAPGRTELRGLLGIWRAEGSGNEYEFRETNRGIEAFFFRVTDVGRSFGFRVGDLSMTNIRVQGNVFDAEIVTRAMLSDCPSLAPYRARASFRHDPATDRLLVTREERPVENCQWLDAGGRTVSLTYVRVR